MIKLSQRDEDINIGDELIFVGRDEIYFHKGDIIKIIDIRESATNNIHPHNKRYFFINLRNDYRDDFGYSTLTDKGFFDRYKSKPHEYSPVEMTGRYRTIGD